MNKKETYQQNGNPICHSFESLWEHLETNYKTNNMKLYTEENVKEAYNLGRTDWINEIEEDYYLFSDLAPIELPSDEEIKEKAKGEYYIEEQRGFIIGAVWMKEQILKQHK